MKLNNKRTFLIGLAFFSICAFWQAYDFVIPLILKHRFSLGDDIAGFVMALDNILARCPTGANRAWASACRLSWQARWQPAR